MLMKLLKDFLISILPPVAVLFIFFLRLVFLPYRDDLDTVAHFMGGASIAWMTLILYRLWTERGWIPKTVPSWLKNFAVWGSVALVGVFWEFWEYYMDTFQGWHSQVSEADTMCDLFMDLLGGLMVILIAQYIFDRFASKKRKR